MNENEMEAVLDGCKITTDVVEKTSKRKFKSPGNTSSRCNKKLISSPDRPSCMPIQPSTNARKFKLQLFPIDSKTKNILEQNDHNPYLELTLAINKKISSVVKHLAEKWADSFSFEAGEVMLFPYDAKSGNLVGVSRWTSNDTHIMASDVFSAIGSPSVFRLRYGFFSNPKAASNEMPPPQLQENYHLQKSVTETNLSSFPVLNEEKASTSLNELSVDDSAGSQQSNVPSKAAALHSWLDSISNLSFGALLTETSPFLEGGNTTAQNKNMQMFQGAITCDSFDAAIGDLIARQKPLNNHVGTPNATNNPSIWDGEQTCHAFTDQKPAPLVGIEHVPHTDAFCSKDVIDLQTEITVESDNADNIERKNEMMPPREESNLLSKIDFSSQEPMGPFENIYACSRPSGAGADSIGFSGLLSPSLDAFQNFSVV